MGYAIAFILGCFCGAIVGVLALAVAVAAKFNQRGGGIRL